MVLPLRLLVTLRINLQQKLALTCLFSVGVIVIVFAFVRLFQVTKATEESKTNPATVANGPILLSLWSVIEAGVAVVVTNLPGFRSLFRMHGNTSISESQDQYRSGYSSGYKNTIGSKMSKGRAALVGRTIEMESLHSSDDEARTRTNDLEEGQENEISTVIDER
jgi:hypothetical protein